MIHIGIYNHSRNITLIAVNDNGKLITEEKVKNTPADLYQILVLFHIRFAERIRRFNRLVQGWLKTFKLANIHGKLQALDSWLRKRLRYCIWHHWKKPERERKNLMRLGVNPENAYAWSRIRMGGWRIVQSPILKTTITLAKMKKRGYIAMVELYRQIRSR